jgi:hypothetical protein
LAVAKWNSASRLRSAIDRDQTGLAQAMNAVCRRLEGSSWLGEHDAWGNYELDERTENALRDEFERCIAETIEICKKALRASGTIATKSLRGEWQEPPDWHERPTCPGMWACGWSHKDGVTILPSVLEITQDDIDRGASFSPPGVFGPIPKRKDEA